VDAQLASERRDRLAAGRAEDAAAAAAMEMEAAAAAAAAVMAMAAAKSAASVAAAEAEAEEHSARVAEVGLYHSHHSLNWSRGRPRTVPSAIRNIRIVYFFSTYHLAPYTPCNRWPEVCTLPSPLYLQEEKTREEEERFTRLEALQRQRETDAAEAKQRKREQKREQKIILGQADARPKLSFKL
jgi:hypothetical protein